MSSEEYDRLARWEGIKYLPKLIVGTIRDRRIMNYMANNEPTSDESADGLSLFYLIRTCKEIVFYKEDGQEKFGLVTFGLDAKTLRICVTSGLELTPNDENDCLQILAFAQVEEVPVLPRYEEFGDALLSLYQKLYEKGFQVTFGTEENRVSLTKKAGAPSGGFDDDRFLDVLSFERLQPPALLVAAKRFAERREGDFRKARRFLDEVETGIDALRATLDKEHNESDLQRCLEAHPILFGAEYRSVAAKPTLGSEYEMDFASINWNGEIHILEIEDSRKMLFTKLRRPSKYLVHAEQQVLDWIDWIRKFPSYAEAKIPLIGRSFGTVVIGRKSPETESALRQRNRIFKNVLEIMTYDHLLEKAESLRDRVANLV